MSEQRVPAEVIGLRYMCDECGGEMVRDTDAAGVLMSNPPQYAHDCPNGHRARLTRSYPGYDIHIEPAPTKSPWREWRGGGVMKAAMRRLVRAAYEQGWRDACDDMIQQQGDRTYPFGGRKRVSLNEVLEPLDPENLLGLHDG